MGNTPIKSTCRKVVDLNKYRRETHCRELFEVPLELVIRQGQATSQLVVPGIAQRYTLSVEGSLETQTILLNGEVLALSDDVGLPELIGKNVARDSIELEPASITFLTAPQAGNTACGPLATYRQE